MRWILLVAVVAAISFAGSAAIAAAATAGGVVYDDGNQCVRNHTTMSRTHNAAIVYSLTDSYFYFPSLQCTYNNAKPHGYLAARWESHKWGFNAGAWLLCGSQGFNYGGGSQLHVGRTVTGCGDGYYLLWGGTYVYNGGWKGGWVGTDYEWFDY